MKHGSALSMMFTPYAELIFNIVIRVPGGLVPGVDLWIQLVAG